MTDNELMDAMAGAVKEYVAAEAAPLAARIVQLEAQIASRPEAAAHDITGKLIAALGKRFLQGDRHAA